MELEQIRGGRVGADHEKAISRASEGARHFARFRVESASDARRSEEAQKAGNFRKGRPRQKLQGRIPCGLQRCVDGTPLGVRSDGTPTHKLREDCGARSI